MGTSLRNARNVLVAGAFLCTSLSAAGFGLPSDAATAGPPPAGLAATKIATQPQAKAGTTGYNGKKWSSAILDLEIDGNSLIAGYGDWNANSDSYGGPNGRTGIVPLNLSTLAWGPITHTGTEANSLIRRINGHLYAPTTDPSLNGRGGYASNKSGTWAVYEPEPVASTAIHVFDIVGVGANELWMFGSTKNPADPSNPAGQATAWRSTDAGQTWSVAKNEGSTPAFGGRGYERYYWGAALGNKVFTQATRTSPATPLWSFDSAKSSWTSMPASAACPGFSSTQPNIAVFKAEAVCGTTATSITTGMPVFNGSTSRTVPWPAGERGAVDFYSDGTSFYILTLDRSGDGRQSIYRASTLNGSWTAMGSLPSNGQNYRTLAVKGNTAYVGTATADIFRAPLGG